MTEEEEDHLEIEEVIKVEVMTIDPREILETDLKDASTVERKDILLKIAQNVNYFLIKPRNQENSTEKEVLKESLTIEKTEVMREETEIETMKEEVEVMIKDSKETKVEDTETEMNTEKDEVVKMTEDQEIMTEKEAIVAKEEGMEIDVKIVEATRTEKVVMINLEEEAAQTVVVADQAVINAIEKEVVELKVLDPTVVDDFIS